MIIIASREEKELLKRLRALGALDDSDKVTKLSGDVLKLKEEVAALELAKARQREEFEKTERELKHMVGLEQKRQHVEREQAAVELEQATKAAKLEVREENLAADKKRFEEQLKFNTSRFEKMESYLKGMLDNILERLPTVTVDRQVKETRRSRK